MFDKFKGMADQFRLIQKAMQDENFRAFVMHPRIQKIFQNPAFQDALKSQDSNRLMNHPDLQELRTDPEIAQLLSKVDFQKLMQK